MFAQQIEQYQAFIDAVFEHPHPDATDGEEAERLLVADLSICGAELQRIKRFLVRNEVGSLLTEAMGDPFIFLGLPRAVASDLEALAFIPLDERLEYVYLPVLRPTLTILLLAHGHIDFADEVARHGELDDPDHVSCFVVTTQPGAMLISVSVIAELNLN